MQLDASRRAERSRVSSHLQDVFRKVILQTTREFPGFFVVPVTCSREGEGRDGGEREGEGSFNTVLCLCGVIL